MRFNAPMYSIYHFSDLIWVRCPQCDRLGKVEASFSGRRRLTAQFSCLTCDAHHEEPVKWFGPVQGVVQCTCAVCGSGIDYTTEPTRECAEQIELACDTCNAVGPYSVKWYRYQGDEPIDRAFGLPLYLQTSVKGNTLWLYNLEHLEYVRSYVSAKLRGDDGRHKYSIVTNLPRWVKSRKNRELIIKKLNGLEARLKMRLRDVE